jgi:mono/diheme cytochrome c family protein
MRTILVILIVVAVFICGAVLFVWSGVYDVAADKPHWKIVDWFLEEVRERSIAVRSENISPPPPGAVQQNLIEGASTYYYGTCILCHGAQGRPPEKFSRGLNPVPPDFASPEWDRPEDMEMFWIIKNGIKMTAMPSFGKEVFKDDQIWAMVDFLKHLPRNEPKK